MSVKHLQAFPEVLVRAQPRQSTRPTHCSRLIFILKPNTNENQNLPPCNAAEKKQFVFLFPPLSLHLIQLHTSPLNIPEEPEIRALKQEWAAEEKKTCLTEFTRCLNVLRSEGT